MDQRRDQRQAQARDHPAEARRLLLALGDAAEAGALRRLDAAFARFLHGLHPQADAAVLLAGALLAHLDGQGHVCLPLEGAPEQARDNAQASGWQRGGAPAGLLRWVAPGLRPWLQTWCAAGLVRLPGHVSGWAELLCHSPLVHQVRQAHQADVAVGANGAAAAHEGDAVPRAATTAHRDDRSPLVLDGTRLYLRRHWRDECRVARHLRARAADTQPIDADRVRPALQGLFPHLAAPQATDAADAAFDGQAAACVLALRGSISLLTGGPGTGKTYTAARLLALAVAMERAEAPLRIALAAPTGKAAARLRQSIAAALDGLVQAGGPAAPWAAALAARLPPARTLHALLGARPDTRHMRHGAANPLPVDLLLVDEASMVHLAGMADLLDALAPATKLVLLGDPDQLASVEAGAVLADLCAGAEQGGWEPDTAALLQACTGRPVPVRQVSDPSSPQAAAPVLNRHTALLRRSHRFGGPIGELALAAKAGDAAAAQALLGAGQGGALHWPIPATRATVLALALQGRWGAPGGYAQALEALRYWAAAQGPAPGAEPAAHTDARVSTAAGEAIATLLRHFDRLRILCAVHDGPWGVKALNAAVEQALARAGLIQPQQPWYPGRLVMVTRNDAAAGVFNGDIGLVLPPLAPGAAVRAAFVDGPGVRLVAVSRLPEVQTAFVMTVHKAQGSEFEHTALVLPPEAGPVLTRELVYTGLTRARSAFTLLTPRPQVLAQALAQRSLRASGLAQRLQATGVDDVCAVSAA